MKAGTPGFNGLRLREAREARGLTAVALADLIGVTRGAVSQYETDRQSPAPQTMSQISRTLNLPVHFFLRPLVPKEPAMRFWRCMNSATKAARVRAGRRHDWLREIVFFLRRYINFPLVSFPALGIGDDPTRIDESQIEEFAVESRRFWAINDDEPIANMVWLLESKGAIVCRCELEAATLDAFSEWDASGGRPYIVLGSDKQSAARSRFDAAHELAHVVLHKDIKGADLGRPGSFKLIEDQAHRFALAFLLPAAPFSEEFYAPSLDALRSMKERWGVSIAAMIIRARQLGLVSESQERNLWINMGRRKWRTREPLDDKMPVEQPRFLRKCIDLLIKRGITAPNELVAQLGLSGADVEKLTGLPSGYLLSAEPEVRLLGDRESADDAGGDILRFPTAS